MPAKPNTPETPATSVTPNAADASPDSRRDELVSAAARLFRELGYERTTVRELAKAVGLQSGSLFHHFRNKEEILMAVMAQGIEAVIRLGNAAVARYTDPADRLAALFRSHMITLLEGVGHDAMIALLYEWRSLSPQGREQIVVLRDAYEALWQSVLDDAAKAGLVHGDTRILRRFILGGMNWTVQWFQPQSPNGQSAAELTERMLASVLPGLPPGAGLGPEQDGSC